MKKQLTAALLCLLATAAQAQVAVTGAWARATVPGQDEGAVYLTLKSAVDDTLTGIDSSEAGMAMLHETSEMGGMSSMHDTSSVALPAGKSVSLAPHGTHIMLMGLTHPLTAGTSIGVSLTFAKAGALKITVPVLPIGAAGPPG